MSARRRAEKVPALTYEQRLLAALHGDRHAAGTRTDACPACQHGEPARPIRVTYRRIQHAAHYSYRHPAVGHDLEQWDVMGLSMPVHPSGVPMGATYHSGYLDRDGQQHYVFTRIAPLSPGRCAQCPIDRMFPVPADVLAEQPGLVANDRGVS